ncbi:MAG: hypothetical protein CL792_03960 [Chloroflexi bacterium]|nr:hypothetical protein [Chloroflexota bacterium]|tara:strand:+ start:476 stop:1492 length:1017 start_codon:yes stop_codon:yes gene_type:complete
MSNELGSAYKQKSEVRKAEAQRNFRIIIGSSVVIAIALLIIAYSAFVTYYLNPRAVVLTVADQDYEVEEIIARGVYYTRDAQIEIDTPRGIATSVIERIKVDEVIKQYHSRLFPQVTLKDIDFALLNQHNVPFTGDDMYSVEKQNLLDDAITKYLNEYKTDRALYEKIFAEQIYRDRTYSHFLGQVEENGPQYNLIVARMGNQQAGERFVTELNKLDSGDIDSITKLFLDTSIIDPVVGWIPSEVLPKNIQSELSSIDENGYTKLIDRGLFFEVYKVHEFSDNKDISAENMTLIARVRMSNWIDSIQQTILIEENMTIDQQKLIDEKVINTFASFGRP